VIALLQISYLIVQLVARKVAGLQSAQLEIGALVFATSSIFIYIIYWNSPQGVESGHKIKSKRQLSKEEIEIVAEFGPYTCGRIKQSDPTTNSRRIWILCRFQ
jgi:hypothetical protein